MRLVWLIFGCLAVLCGLAGVVLPLVPTVPFLLLAAFCFARSSDRLHDWLVEHPRFGPPIRHWRASRAIGRRAKRAATVSLFVAFGISLALGAGPWVLAAQAVALTGVAVFLWTRPDAEVAGLGSGPPPDASDDAAHDPAPVAPDPPVADAAPADERPGSARGTDPRA